MATGRPLMAFQKKGLMGDSQNVGCGEWLQDGDESKKLDCEEKI